MRIRFKATGEECHVENTAGRAYIAQAMAEEVKPAPPAPAQPVWSVGFDESGYAFVKLELGKLGVSSENPQGKFAKSVQFFQGDPEKIHDRKYPDGRLYASAFGRPVPENVVANYRVARRTLGAILPGPKTTDDYNRDHADIKKRLDAAVARKPVFTEYDAIRAQAESENIGAPLLFVSPDPKNQKPMSEPEGGGDAG